MTDDLPDDPLLGELRRLTKRVDPVPDEVTAYARAALGWRRVDAELAELLDDSRLAAGSARGGDGPRTLTFRASGLEIAVELADDEGTVRLLGQIVPPSAAAVEIQRDDGTSVVTADVDELGRFRLELSPGMRIRIVVRRDGDADVESSWFDV